MMNRPSRTSLGALCLLAVLLSPAARAAQSIHDAQLGRLFFTPERRQALDRQRLSNIQEAQSLEGETLSLDGVVQRSSGKSTLWINGRAQDAHDAGNGVSARLTPRDPGIAQIVPGEEAPIRLKVGEEINRATGERNDRLGGGLIKTPNQRR